MKEKIPQHHHCRNCGKAYVGDSGYCSPECEHGSKETLAKKKRQLLLLYVISVIILIAAVVYVGVA